MKRIYYKCITSHNLDKTILTVHNCNYLKLAFAFDFTCGIVELSLIQLFVGSYYSTYLYLYIYYAHLLFYYLPTVI